MTTRLPDAYFDRMYAGNDDPWQLSTRWYEQRKYAITLALLPHRRYRHAFEPGCSIGTLTALLALRCDHVTAVDVADAAVRTADARLRDGGLREQVTLARSSLDEAWPAGPFDLLVLSEVAYYLDADALAAVLRRECRGLAAGRDRRCRTLAPRCGRLPAHRRRGPRVIADTPGLTALGCYRDRDVVVEVFDNGDGQSVAAREEVPGAC